MGEHEQLLWASGSACRVVRMVVTALVARLISFNYSNLRFFYTSEREVTQLGHWNIPRSHYSSTSPHKPRNDFIGFKKLQESFGLKIH
ncbi:hypothetical protein NC651_024639 [Populus alba x Populus x berolinensis]|nr:hypothetical protein NC651_024639 [Populus alba x Populus x berolinensis]